MVWKTAVLQSATYSEVLPFNLSTLNACFLPGSMHIFNKDQSPTVKLEYNS